MGQDFLNMKDTLSSLEKMYEKAKWYKVVEVEAIRYVSIY